MTTSDVQKRVEAVQGRVLEQLEGAQKQLKVFEKEMLTFGRTQQKEIERLVKRVRSGKELKALGKKAQTATKGLRAQLDAMERSVLDAVGVASSDQVRALASEVSRLKKQVAKLSRSEPQA